MRKWIGGPAAVLGLAAALSMAPSAASACQDGFYEACAIVCICVPNSGTVVGAATRPATELGAAGFGAALQQWLQQSRNSAIGTSAPVPFAIRQALQGYVEDDVLNRARYKVGDSGLLNAANNIEHFGDTSAVTLIDVIVFRGPSEANNPSLWAHELWHVRQFRDWGVQSFAVQYVRNYRGVEEPAEAAGDGYAAWRQTHNASPIPGNNPFPPPGQYPQPAMTNICRTPVLACMIQPGPVGMGCYCNTPYGPSVGSMTPY